MSARISTVMLATYEPSTNALKRRKPSFAAMRDNRTASALALVTVIALLSPIASGDSVISSEEVEILEAGSFQNSADWSFSSTKGFTLGQADYTVGMIADGYIGYLVCILNWHLSFWS